MLGRPHVSFCGLRHDTRKLVNHVEYVVGSDLCEICGSSDPLVAPVLLLVQQLFLQLIQGQFRPFFGGVRGVAAFIP